VSFKAQLKPFGRARRAQGAHERAASSTSDRTVIPHDAQRRSHVASTRRTLVALIAPAAEAAGTRAGVARAAKRHTIAYVKRYGITLRTSDVDLQCSVTGRSRWKCFVYANGGQCTGTLTEVYSMCTRAYRARNIDIGCGE
jgi:hypothetical protein